jgi:hypothetical protein
LKKRKFNPALGPCNELAKKEHSSQKENKNDVKVERVSQEIFIIYHDK